MPYIELAIDSSYYRIASPDYDMCGKWIGQILSMHPITLVTRVMLQISPMLVPNPIDLWGTAPWVPDWEANSTRQFCPSLEELASPAAAALRLAELLGKYAAELPGADQLRDQAP